MWDQYLYMRKRDAIRCWNASLFLFVVLIVAADYKTKLISSDQSTKTKLPKILDNTCLKVENNPQKISSLILGYIKTAFSKDTS